jgi:hypothetical protein
VGEGIRGIRGLRGWDLAVSDAMQCYIRDTERRIWSCGESNNILTVLYYARLMTSKYALMLYDASMHIRDTKHSIRACGAW